MKERRLEKAFEQSEMTGDRWLSVDEIADHLGVKRDAVYKWISERQMPGHKIGRLWKFNKTAVDEWVRSAMSSRDWLRVGKRSPGPRNLRIAPLALR